METCTDSSVGRMLPFYEADTLEPEQTLQFEEHLLVCDFCRLEVESSMEISQKLSRHRDAVRKHYAETGANFAAELANLANDRNRNPVRAQQSFSLRTVIAWMNASAARRIVFPSVAIALLAVIVVVKTYLPTTLTPIIADSSPGQVVQPAVPPTTGDSNVSTREPKSTPIATERTKTGEDTGSPDGEKLKRVEQLLPKHAIPYIAIATRSSDARDSTFTAEFQRCMAIYERGDYVHSASRLRELTAVHPTHEQAQLYLGSALYMSGDNENAIAALSKTEQLAGERVDPKVTLYRAAALIKLQRYSDARPVLERLVGVPNRTVAEQSRNLLTVLKQIE